MTRDAARTLNAQERQSGWAQDQAAPPNGLWGGLRRGQDLTLPELVHARTNNDANSEWYSNTITFKHN